MVNFCVSGWRNSRGRVIPRRGTGAREGERGGVISGLALRARSGSCSHGSGVRKRGYRHLRRAKSGLHGSGVRKRGYSHLRRARSGLHGSGVRKRGYRHLRCAALAAAAPKAIHKSNPPTGDGSPRGRARGRCLRFYAALRLRPQPLTQTTG